MKSNFCCLTLLFLFFSSVFPCHATIIEYDFSGYLGYRPLSSPHDPWLQINANGSLYIDDDPWLNDAGLPRYEIISYDLLIGDNSLSANGDLGRVRFSPYGHLDIGGGSFEIFGSIFPEGADPYGFLPSEFRTDPAYGTIPTSWTNLIGPQDGYQYWYSSFELAAVPVPEPATLTMLGYGLLALLIRRKSKYSSTKLAKFC